MTLEVMKTQTLDLRGTKVLLVETTGTYVNMAMNPADVEGEAEHYALRAPWSRAPTPLVLQR